MRVLCVDPGPHVGIATWTDRHVGGDGSGPGSTHYYTEKFQAWETTPEKFYAEVDPWVQWAEVVVCEGFVISGPRAKEANATIEMIGVLRYLAALKHRRFVVQRPGAYKFAGADKLKRLGWYSKSDHVRSATGHLVLYLAESGLIDGARLLPSESEGGNA